MGMGYGANYADVVEEKFVREVAGDELATFKAEFEKINDAETNTEVLSEIEIRNLLEYDYLDVLKDANNPNFELCNSYDNLLSKFKEKTGLDLSLEYHSSSDNGDRYDEVDGFFWCVSGMYELTKAGLRNVDNVVRKFYVTFG